MNKKILFIIDEPKTLNTLKDTSLLLIKAALKLNYKVSYARHNDLFVINNQPHGNTKTITSFTNCLDQVKQNKCNLNSFDFIFIRKDPPFDKNYLFLTLILDLVNDAKIINNPLSLQSHNEKLSILNFPHLITKTLVSANSDQIKKFIFESKEAVAKPIDEMAGNKIFFIKPGDKNLNVVLEVLTNYGETQIIVQKFIPEIKKGDKRIIIVNGEPIPYALVRVPRKDDFRGNLAKGGNAKIQKLTTNDHKIIKDIKNYLIKKDLRFVGIDIIGNYLSEINVTSPTGLIEIEKLTKKNVSEEIVKKLF